MSDEKALCSLVETRSYRYCLERREIWALILKAIRDDEWIDEVAADARVCLRHAQGCREWLRSGKNDVCPVEHVFSGGVRQVA
jgi:hypothetical protein